jgi:uncharacterized protein YdhG (YjbR/CyaY superfamily)
LVIFDESIKIWYFSNNMKKYKTVDEYLDDFSGETKKKLVMIRETIQKMVPEATEKISYGIPTFYLNGNLVHYAGFKNHIGFFPGAAPLREFEKDLTDYKTSKGTVQFPLSQPLPLELIKKITLACVERNQIKKK